MSISSTVIGVPDRAFNNALKARLRDPTRSTRFIDFMTFHERESLVFTSLGDPAYEAYLQRRADLRGISSERYNLQWREFDV